MEHPPPRSLLAFLKPYDLDIRKLALGLRALVLQEMAPCRESIFDAYNAVALGYGPTGRLKDDICHIAVYAKHVNLGFNQGATLDDPDRLLQGTGKRVRHMTLRAMADLKRPEIRTYLRRARQQGQQAVALGREGATVVSVVKSVSPKKRRPIGQARGAGS